ncbi:hypothetical protein TWF281_006610 [Arthrobotrys megalospora]
MPRRGLFRRANEFGVFDQLGNPLPEPGTASIPPPHGEQQPAAETPAAAAAAPNPDNLAEMLAAVMPGAFPQFQEAGEQPAQAQAPTGVPQAPQPNLPLQPAVPLVRREGRFRRIVNHFHDRGMIPADFQAPPAPQMSWTEIRAKLGDPPPPPNPVESLFDWDKVRYRIGIRPTYEWQAVHEQQQQQARLQNQANMQAQMQTPFQPQVAQTMPAQPQATSPWMLIQTPQGSMYIPQPPPPGAENPFTGQPTENPWSQQDAKGLATVLLLAGMKLTWNAATSMWDAATAAYNQNFEDKVKLRDQTNQWINDCIRTGHVMPVQAQQAPAQQYDQQWPQWQDAQQQAAEQPLPRRWI